MINLLFDINESGGSGMRRSLPLLTMLAPVRLLWGRESQQNQFVIRQLESLTRVEWQLLYSQVRI